MGHLGNIEDSHESERKVAQRRVSSAVASVMVRENSARSERSEVGAGVGKRPSSQKSRRKSSVQEIQSIMYQNNESGTADLSQLQRLNSQREMDDDEDDDNASDSSDNDEEDELEKDDSNFNDSSMLIPSNDEVSAHLDRAKTRRTGRRRASVANRRAGLARNSNRVSVGNIESIEEYLKSNITDTISVHDMDFSDGDFQRVIAGLEEDSIMNHITNVDFKGCKLDAGGISSVCTLLTRVASNYAAHQRCTNTCC